MKATIYAHFLKSPERAWFGTVLVSFAGGPTVQGEFIDRGISKELDRLLEGKTWRGTERFTVTLPDGAFDVLAQFVGVPSATPALYTLNETGDVVAGSGRYADASGHVTVHGPFLSPVLIADAPPFIGEMEGTICGAG